MTTVVVPVAVVGSSVEDDVLLDDRALVEVGGDVVRRGTRPA
jgi:hypothetical protein